MGAEKRNGRVAVYSRKSRFTGRGESIENQIELCRRYLADRGETGGILIYEDEGFSGGNLDRPQFRKMMKDARAGKFSAIVCYRLDRISRNIGDFAELIEELNRLHISFVSVKEQFDTSSPMGRAMMYIASVFSQLERETIAERIRDNMLELAKTGRWLGGTTPTGYASEAVRTITSDGKTRKSCKLRLIPEEAETVRLIFETFIRLNSLTKAETFLMQNGVKTKNGRWYSRFSIRNILTNPVYMTADQDAFRCLRECGAELFARENDFDGKHGVMAYNKTAQGHRSKQPRETSEWIVTVGKHPGIVTGAQWAAVQRQLEQNRSKSFHKPRSGVALLSGLLRCGECGSFMRPKLSRRCNTDGEQIYVYLCEMKERSHGQKCGMKNAPGNHLDRAVCEEIKKLPEDRGAFLTSFETGMAAVFRSAESHTEEAEHLRKALTTAEREISSLVECLAEAENTPARGDIMRRINELHEQCQRIQEQLKGLEYSDGSQCLSTSELSGAVRLLTSFGETFDAMEVEQKRAALRGLLEKVVWNGETVQLYFCGAQEESPAAQPPGNALASPRDPLCDRRK